MNNQIRLIGILIKDRQAAAAKVQSVLTEFGCIIKTRLGMHDTSDLQCSRHGLVILELNGSIEEMDKLEKALGEIQGIESKVIKFDW